MFTNFLFPLLWSSWHDCWWLIYSTIDCYLRIVYAIALEWMQYVFFLSWDSQFCQTNCFYLFYSGTDGQGTLFAIKNTSIFMHIDCSIHVRWLNGSDKTKELYCGYYFVLSCWTSCRRSQLWLRDVLYVAVALIWRKTRVATYINFFLVWAFRRHTEHKSFFSRLESFQLYPPISLVHFHFHFLAPICYGRFTGRCYAILDTSS